MKKLQLKIAVLSLSALVFFSCKKDEKPAVNGDVMTFTGTIGGGGAKTEIDGLEMTWSTDDKVLINGEVFDSELTSDHKTAVFTGVVEPADKYKAYYPASLYDKTENKYVLPATQHYAGEDGKILSKVSPMYAESGTTDLQFHNICAMMKLDVKGEGRVREISVSANKDGQPALLSGAFDVKGDAFAGYYAKISSDGGLTSLTLTIDFSDGVELKADKATTFYIAIPQGEYTDLVFTLKDGNGSIYSSSPVTRILEAGKMHVRELVGVFIEPPEGAIPGLFSVSADKKVLFSKGNLYCVKNGDHWGNGYEWRFAENQWDVVETTAEVSLEYEYQDVVTLFGWGTSGQPHGAYLYWPYCTIQTNGGYEAYGFDDKNLYDNDGSADWGYSYCKQENIEPATTWRTLRKDEWTHLFTARTVNGGTGEGHSYRYATINSDAESVCGMILYPDGYTLGSKPSYTSSEWARAESAGCVFLPAAGDRNGTSVSGVGSYGHYWSSSYFSKDSVCCMNFSSANVNLSAISHRSDGKSVRLVRDAK